MAAFFRYGLDNYRYGEQGTHGTGHGYVGPGAPGVAVATVKWAK